jgi:hypothetical protein
LVLCLAASLPSSNLNGGLDGVNVFATHIPLIALRNQAGGSNKLSGPSSGSGKNAFGSASKKGSHWQIEFMAKLDEFH